MRKKYLKRSHFHYPKKRNFAKLFVATGALTAIILVACIYFYKKNSSQIFAEVNGVKIYKNEIDAIDLQNKKEIAKEAYGRKKLLSDAKSRMKKNNHLSTKIKNAQDKVAIEIYVEDVIKENVNDKAIQGKYSELANKIDGKKEYDISYILTKDKILAEKILRELKKSSFDKVSKKYLSDKAASSERLGFVFEDDLIDEILSEVSEIKKGKTSDIIQAKSGFYIIKLHDVRNAELPEFEGVKESLKRKIMDEERKKIYDKLTKNLKIKIFKK